MQTLPKLILQISITQKMHAIILRNIQYTHYTSTCFALFIGYEKTFFLFVVVYRENFDNQVLIRIYTPPLRIDKYGSRSGNLWIGADSHISFKAPDGRVDIRHATYLGTFADSSQYFMQQQYQSTAKYYTANIKLYLLIIASNVNFRADMMIAVIV